MINTFIPSKDRASQLLLLLESLDKNANGMFKPHVMYKSSNDQFAVGYEIVKQNKAGENVVWIPEVHGENEFYGFLEENAAKDELVCLFSDDCIFYRPTTLSEKCIRGMMGKSTDLSSILSFSFRLGLNITVKDYVSGQRTQFPKAIGYTPWYFFWEWDQIDFWDMFGFTVGFDGYIYHAKDLIDISDHSNFDGRICFWEKMICQKFQQKRDQISKRCMAAPYKSCVFVEQINITHEYGHRTNNTFHCSKEELNNRLLNRYKIDLESMDFSKTNCTHGEMSFGVKVL